ncbi:MAG: hypothetical protein IPM60_12510 [Rhodospirillales bacterium]|nr:hypothetical protein [Rhodospirillales bacterium]
MSREFCRLLLRLSVIAVAVSAPIAASQALGSAGVDPGAKPRCAEGYVRAYGSRAPWNIPVKGLPLEDPETEADLVRALLAASGNGALAIGTIQSNLAVYRATADTPRVEIIADNHPEWGNLRSGQRVPWDPRWPVWLGPARTDRGAVVLEMDTGREWNLNGVRGLQADGRLLVRRGNLVVTSGRAHHPITAPPADWRTYEGSMRGLRACGIQTFAMLTTAEEWRQGYIPHAVPLLVHGGHPRAYRAPATSPHGNNRWSNAAFPPLGTRYFLDISDAEIEAAVHSSRKNEQEYLVGLRAFLVALRDYGGFVCDGNASKHIGTWIETVTTAGWSFSNPGYDISPWFKRHNDRWRAIVASDRYPAKARSSEVCGR